MTEPTRGRGRPNGSELDDSAVLFSIAEQIEQDGSLKPAQAMRKFCAKSGRKSPSEAELRRWHSKWSTRRTGLILAVVERKAKSQHSNDTGLSDAQMRQITASIAEKLLSMGPVSSPALLMQIREMERIGRLLSESDLGRIDVMRETHKMIFADDGLASVVKKIQALQGAFTCGLSGEAIDRIRSLHANFNQIDVSRVTLGLPNKV